MWAHWSSSLYRSQSSISCSAVWVRWLYSSTVGCTNREGTYVLVCEDQFELIDITSNFILILSLLLLSLLLLLLLLLLFEFLSYRQLLTIDFIFVFLLVDTDLGSTFQPCHIRLHQSCQWIHTHTELCRIENIFY